MYVIKPISKIYLFSHTLASNKQNMQKPSFIHYAVKLIECLVICCSESVYMPLATRRTGSKKFEVREESVP